MTHILIAEDNDQSRYMLQALLSGHGHEVVTATNGAEALEKARREPPEIIITDILMPVMDGFTLCRRWKSDERLKKIPFVFYTATYTDPKDEDFALDLGAERFLVKPVEPEALLKMLEEVLAEHETKGLVASSPPVLDDAVYLQQYNQTLVRKLEDKIQQLAESNRKLDPRVAQVEAQNAELERFAYTISHDLKSPLITISGYVGVLDQDMASGNAEAIADDLARIRNAATKMAQLLDEVMQLSRIGRLVNPSEDVAMGTLAHQGVELVRGQIDQRGIQVEISPDLPVVLGDRSRLLQVMQNLIENAVKYLGDQPRPRIEIGSRLCDDETICYVRDNGIGIEPCYHERIFGLFDQLDQKAEGTGVGLALVKRIVEIHGGRIWVESEGPGRGSTFCFTIPSSTKCEETTGGLQTGR